MALLTVSRISKAGIADISAAMVAADVAGDSVSPSGGLMIAVTNGDASAHTVTVTKPTATTSCAGYGTLDVEDIVVTVSAGDTAFFAIPSAYIDGSGNFAWSYDAVTSVTVGVFSISP